MSLTAVTQTSDLGRICGAKVFEPKRELILETPGGEIGAFVLEGDGSVSRIPNPRPLYKITQVHLDGVVYPFRNRSLNVGKSFISEVSERSGFCELDVVFRFIDGEEPEDGDLPELVREVIAVSFDGSTFHDNELCTLWPGHHIETA